MARNRVQYNRRFIEALEEISPDFRVAAFYLMVNGFSNVMQQARTPCDSAVEVQFVAHDLRQKRNFNAVAQNVLSIAGSKVQSAN